MHYRLFIVSSDEYGLNLEHFKEQITHYMDAHSEHDPLSVRPFQDYWGYGCSYTMSLYGGTEWMLKIKSEIEALPAPDKFDSAQRKERQSQIDAIHETYTPVDIVPLTQRTRNFEGLDDIQILTAEMLEHVLSEYVGKCIQYHWDDSDYVPFHFLSPSFIVVDNDPLDSEMVGKRFVAVIDYHS